MTLGELIEFDGLKRQGRDLNSKMPLRAIFRLGYFVPVLFTSPYHNSGEKEDTNMKRGIRFQFNALRMIESGPKL